MTGDRIVVEDLPARAHVGVSEEERAQEQELRIDLELGIDLERAGRSDALEDTRDYERACRVVVEVAAARPFRLIEALAEALAGALLSEMEVDEVFVRVRKPEALRAWGARHAAVEIRRRADG